MQFNYKNYVTRYKYEPYYWPPDLGLSQLHARCSEPGPPNDKGIKCPCCQSLSKKKVHKWWKRSINQDVSQYGSAVPGYFQLIKYYACFTLIVFLMNSIYMLYCTYYACGHLDPNNQYCLKVGILQYIQYNDLKHILNSYGRSDMSYNLQILQTTVFYILLAANYFSVVYITFLNQSAKMQFKQLKQSQSNRCLVFSNISKKSAENLSTILKLSQQQNLSIIKSLQLYQIKRYYQNFQKRNKVYYYLLSLYVIAENPLRLRNLNKQLQKYHNNVLEEKEKFQQFSGRVIVMFENIQQCHLIHRIYRIKLFKKFTMGIKYLLSEFGIYKLQSQQQLATYQIGLGSDIIWQNLGEKIGVKMAIRIKSFFVAMVFIIICYIILYYPILFSLKTHIKAETKKFTKLNTFQKILPNLTALILVGISIYFRIYMQRLSQRRNPKDHLQKSRFVLITCLTFHILFYVVIPTVFFIAPNEINGTIKLYIISQQARIFIVTQIIIVFVDFPYRMWKSKKIQALSDQRVAFRSNQQMLHKIVQCRDYPLQIRLQVLFRIWSLVLFYSFFVPYVLVYVIISFFILFWIQKRNLYKHYTIRRKVSIKLESDTLMYYVNFFCLYLCFVYCVTVKDSPIKVTIAVIITVGGLVSNILYWLILNKAESKSEQILLHNTQQLTSQVALLKKQKLTEVAQKFEQQYHKFLHGIQNDKLDEQISEYLRKFRQYQKQHKKNIKKQQSIQLSQFNHSLLQPNAQQQQTGYKSDVQFILTNIQPQTYHNYA